MPAAVVPAPVRSEEAWPMPVGCRVYAPPPANPRCSCVSPSPRSQHRARASPVSAPACCRPPRLVGRRRASRHHLPLDPGPCPNPTILRTWACRPPLQPAAGGSWPAAALGLSPAVLRAGPRRPPHPCAAGRLAQQDASAPHTVAASNQIRGRARTPPSSALGPADRRAGRRSAATPAGRHRRSVVRHERSGRKRKGEREREGEREEKDGKR
ncbi:hypothetical protein PVAP13_4NG088351 [Panicum virgatum]|uniref:Uncharacterized protein n=1 Tax=Panicum virgatum TaxID=38727 RepID=A0A8T0TBW6_PANVG|nr:hypothetical protein PVAP13_4NG088351 [Panicum virgatum]